MLCGDDVLPVRWVVRLVRSVLIWYDAFHGGGISTPHTRCVRFDGTGVPFTLSGGYITFVDIGNFVVLR